MQDMRVQMYIPMEPAAPREHVQFHLIEGCGGLTAWDADGYWTSPDGGNIDEPVRVLEVYLEDTPDNRLWVEAVAREYKDAADQECVLYVINQNETFFIED